MANSMMTARDLLDKYDLDIPEDFVREMMELALMRFMEAEVSAQIGADRYEHSEERTAHRNGYRHRRWDTRAGSVELAIPRLRKGSYYPSFLQHRKRSERALMAVVHEAYINGMSTRRIEKLARALGVESLSKSTVSRMCAELDDLVETWNTRQLEEPIVYLFLDATFKKVRENGRTVSCCVLLAVGVTADGKRRVLGVDVATKEAGAAWRAFLRSLVRRGLHGVLLVISDAHEGLKAAIASELTGTTWQRCRAHFMRNLLAQIRKVDEDDVTKLVKSIFAQVTGEDARKRLHEVVDELEERYPKAAALLADAEEELLAYTAFPSVHWKKLWTNNGAERLNREITRRTDAVGIFPNRAAVLRLVGALLMEQDEDWMTGRRYMNAKSMAEAQRREINRADRIGEEVLTGD